MPGCAAGLFWQNDISPWFSVRAALSAAFTSLMYVDSGLADAGTAQQLEAFALTQLNYAMGALFRYAATTRGALCHHYLHIF